LIKTFEDMQDEAFRIQKDMYIRIKDLELLDLSKSQIYEIMKKQGTSTKVINNLLSGRFTPVNYSKPRFESKVKLVKDQMKKLSEESDQFFYSANRSFLFPQRELDKVISKYSGKKFFEETFNEETKEFEGGYYPDKTKYKTNSEGRLVYDSEGNPVKEPGFIERQLKKIPSLLKDIALPGGVPGFSSKPQAPPLGDMPMPKKMVANVQQKNPQTNLTQNEEALLSPTEKVIAART